MILSDRDIRAAMQRLENPLIIDPGFAPERLQPASLELTMAGTTYSPLRDREYGPYPLGSLGVLEPGDFVLGHTAETVHIPTDLVAQVNGKSSWARKGLIVHTTAGFIDPGFRGQITLEFKNLGEQVIKIPVGAPICQLVFFQMTSPAERPYGSVGLGSHYQGQRGPTPSRG